MSSKINLVANVIVHIIILLTFWVIVYKNFAFDIGREAFRDQLKGAIKNVTDPLKKQYPQFKTMKYDTERFSKLTLASQAINRQALLDILYIVGALLLGASLLPKLTSEKIDWMHILKENAITYVFVGLVEVIFFIKIAKNYSPILPSQLKMNAKKEVADHLSCV
jgi:hypothetical protein